MIQIRIPDEYFFFIFRIMKLNYFILFCSFIDYYKDKILFEKKQFIFSFSEIFFSCSIQLTKFFCAFVFVKAGRFLN